MMKIPPKEKTTMATSQPSDTEESEEQSEMRNHREDEEENKMDVSEVEKNLQQQTHPLQERASSNQNQKQHNRFRRRTWTQ
jgi:hypothetical protein